MKQYTYYPGCSVKGTAKQYEESLLAVFNALDLKLNELDDWNCCGATLYMSVDNLMSFTLSARNLAKAAMNGQHDLVTPCSACYLVLLKTQDHIKRYPAIREKVNKALRAADLKYQQNVKVRHPLEVLLTDVGLEEIRKKVKTPLRGYKIAPYYGCQIVRPYSEFNHGSFPTSLDQLFEALGAEVVDYPLKTRCCGGSLTGTLEEVGLRLNYILLHEAVKRGANIMTTVCPLCQFNLECYQNKINSKYKTNIILPVVYFTQLMGLALGISKKALGLERNLVPLNEIAEAA
jgi:heterodisulfide reductase subunit B